MIKEITERRSIRKYVDKEVSEEMISEILESARLAPSGNNTQPWNFIIVRDDDKKAEIMKADGEQQWMISAPVFIVCIADIRCRIKDGEISIDENSPQPEVKQIIRDTAIAVTHIMLAAENLGIGTCWTGNFVQKDMRPILGIPDDKYVLGVITLGYADEKPDLRPRRATEDIIRYEKW